jgi:hypothetical protein
MTKPWGNSTLMPCGTDAAYSRHCRRGEPRDAQCRAAHSRTNQERKRRRNGREERVGKVRQRVAGENAARELIKRHAGEYAVLVTAALLRLSEAR